MTINLNSSVNQASYNRYANETPGVQQTPAQSQPITATPAETTELAANDTMQLQSSQLPDTPLENVNVFDHEASPNPISRLLDEALGLDKMSQDQLQDLQKKLQDMMQVLGGQSAGSSLNQIKDSLEQALAKINKIFEDLEKKNR